MKVGEMTRCRSRHTENRASETRDGSESVQARHVGRKKLCRFLERLMEAEDTETTTEVEDIIHDVWRILLDCDKSGKDALKAKVKDHKKKEKEKERHRRKKEKRRAKKASKSAKSGKSRRRGSGSDSSSSSNGSSSDSESDSSSSEASSSSGRSSKSKANKGS